MENEVCINEMHFNIKMHSKKWEIIHLICFNEYINRWTLQKTINWIGLDWVDWHTEWKRRKNTIFRLFDQNKTEYTANSKDRPLFLSILHIIFILKKIIQFVWSRRHNISIGKKCLKKINKICRLCLELANVKIVTIEV